MAHVHLIGIGGSGLSAIARVLLESGQVVSGSDRQDSPFLQSLMAAGARVSLGHRAENVLGADWVVRSSAVTGNNVEVQAAQAAGIPVLKRAEFVGQMLQGRRCVAVAGTHGKTTTTAMIAWMLTAAGLQPGFIIGGLSANLGSNASAGSGPLFVIEADEYDRMFLGLDPELAVITNLEHDHPDCFPTEGEYRQAFEDFAARLKPGGTLLACSDDAGGRELLRWAQAGGRQAFSYGLYAWSGQVMPDYQAVGPVTNETGGCDAWARFGSERLVFLSLQVPGRHNLLNALAALAVAHRLGLDLQQAAAALGEFSGVGRRFELRGEAGGVVVVDDYAHHPTEVQATLQAARQRYAQRRLWAVWQPHTYSRTRTLLDAFASAFRAADRVLVTEIYAAREKAPEDGFSARLVVQAMQHAGARFCATQEEAAGVLLDELLPGDVLLVLSAGDADQLSGRVLAGLMDRRQAALN